MLQLQRHREGRGLPRLDDPNDVGVGEVEGLQDPQQRAKGLQGVGVRHVVEDTRGRAGQKRGGGVAEFFAEIVWEIYMGLCAKMSNKSARSKACVANNVASYTGSKPNLAQNSPENTLIDPA